VPEALYAKSAHCGSPAFRSEEKEQKSFAMTKPKLSVAQREAEREIQTALAAEARSGDRHESKASIARRVYNGHPSQVHILQKPWILERLVRMLDKIERLAAAADQLPLPGINLPPVIKLLKPDPESKEKQRPIRMPLLNATLPQLVQYRKELARSLRHRHDSRIEAVDQAIALMKKFAPRSRKATLREVLEKHGQEILDFTEEARGASG
jgi:hypothetical protein